MRLSDRHCDSRVGFDVRFGAVRQFYLFQRYSFEVFDPRHQLYSCLIMPKLMDYSHFETGSYLINGCSRLRILRPTQKYLYPNPNRKLRKRVLLVVLAVLFDSQLDYSDQFWIHFGQEVNDLFEKDSCTRPKSYIQLVFQLVFWRLYGSCDLWAISMLVTDVGDGLWRLWDVGDRFLTLKM